MPYNRRYSSKLGLGLLTGSVVNQIILINEIIYVVELFLARTAFVDFFGLTPHVVVSKGYAWQLITYMFLHGNPWHLLLNMFIVWMFGTPLESIWGSNRFLTTISCAASAARS
jgi:membrane associated rhomboid family serine protease